MYICENDSCRQDNPYPGDYTFTGTLDTEGYVANDNSMSCDECGGRVEWCDYCTTSEFCEEHGVEETRAGEVVRAKFSEDVEWIEKAKV